MERRPLRDLDAKSFLSIKQILAYLLKGTVEAYEGKSVSEIVGFLNAELSEKDRENYRLQGLRQDIPAGSGKIEVDLHFTASYPRNGRAFFDVEAQNSFVSLRFHLDRATMYNAAMIAQERGESVMSNEYNKLEPTFSIWIFTDPPKFLENVIARTKTVLENKLTGEIIRPDQPEQYESSVVYTNTIFIGLGDREQIQEKDHPEAIENQLLELLDASFYENEVSKQEFLNMLAEREIYLPNEEITEEVTGMLMMAETRYKHGLAEGRAEGRAEAHAEDRAAFVKSYVETVKSVLAATDWTTDKAIEIVTRDQQLANEVREALEKEQQEEADKEDPPLPSFSGSDFDHDPLDDEKSGLEAYIQYYLAEHGTESPTNNKQEDIDR